MDDMTFIRSIILNARIAKSSAFLLLIMVDTTSFASSPLDFSNPLQC